MKFFNSTKYKVATALNDAVAAFPMDDLTVELKYCPKGSRRYVSGTYYRKVRNYEDGRLIRLRINRFNRYPVEVHFKTSEYYKKIVKGKQITYQKLRLVKFETAEDLILGVFLHEYSHYLDHIEGRNGRYKQTKADKFALELLEKLGVIEKE